MQFSSDGSKIVVGSWDELVHVLDNEANEPKTLAVPDEGVHSAVISLAISPDGKWVATGEVGNVCLWGTKRFDLQKTNSLGDSTVSRLSFSPDDNRLAIGAEAVYVLDPIAGVSLCVESLLLDLIPLGAESGRECIQ